MKLFLKNAVVLFLVTLIFGCNTATKTSDEDTIEGWQCDPVERMADWKLVGEEIVGANPHEKGSILWTTKKYKDFEITLDYITDTKQYDTGVFLRGESHQVQIGISGSLKKDMSACIYAPKDNNGSYPVHSDKIPEFHKVGEWNNLRIVTTGKRIQTFLNGEPFVDYTGVVIPDEGPIGLQLHGNVNMKVRFKNINIKEL